MSGRLTETDIFKMSDVRFLSYLTDIRIRKSIANIITFYSRVLIKLNKKIFQNISCSGWTSVLHRDIILINSHKCSYHLSYITNCIVKVTWK